MEKYEHKQLCYTQNVIVHLHLACCIADLAAGCCLSCLIFCQIIFAISLSRSVIPMFPLWNVVVIIIFCYLFGFNTCEHFVEYLIFPTHFICGEIINANFHFHLKVVGNGSGVATFCGIRGFALSKMYLCEINYN